MGHADSTLTDRSNHPGAAELFRNTFEHASIGMALASPVGKWMQVNPALCEMLGRTQQDMLAANLQAVVHPDDLADVQKQTEQLLAGAIESFNISKRLIHASGRMVLARITASRVQTQPNGPATLVLQFVDITEQTMAAELITHQCTHDALTGLPNRLLVRDRIDHCIQRARRNPNYHFAVLAMDLDRFNNVNDGLGHDFGDQLLVAVSKKIQSCLRVTDTLSHTRQDHTVARTGGDEFMLVLDDIRGGGDAVRVAQRILSELTSHYEVSGQEVFTSVSIGIAYNEVRYDKPDDMIRDASAAMCRAKTTGKNRYAIFDPDMHEAALSRLRLETDLRHAAERNQFVLNYQPILSLKSGELVGFEALIRWDYPEHGLLFPRDFLPLAEQTGISASMAYWALRAACEQLRAWQKRSPLMDSLGVSVNLSASQLMDAQLAQQIESVLADTGIIPACLRLEITEDALMANGPQAAQALKQIRNLGVQVELDDFGSGYASLSCIHQYPLDGVKVDMGFGRKCDSQRDWSAVVRAIFALTRSLGLNVAAEAVEAPEQVALLKSLDCDLVQGRLISDALGAEAAEAFIVSSLKKPKTA